MNKLEFLEEKLYVPYTGCIPGEWLKHSFETLDFTGREKLKDFLAEYFEEFKFQGRDSIMLGSNEFAFKVFISMYREIASHIPVEAYKFFDWGEYSAMIKSQGYKGERAVVDDCFGKNFIFIFDLVLSLEKDADIFSKILDYAYIHKTRLFVVSRSELSSLSAAVPEAVTKIYQEKFVQMRLAQ